MANHKWENDKCVQCGLYRNEIETPDKGLHFQYSFDNKNWLSKRPECEKSKSYIQSINIKEKANNLRIDTNIVDYKKTYSDLLRSPKWQRKRLEIMQRDDWKCQSCHDDSHELHVHHLQYTNQNPWDEPDDNLITLCDTCHRAMHYLLGCNDSDIGIETFVSICMLYNKLEVDSINKYSEKNKI